jgi:Ca-activated chloride channel homolog
MTTVGFGMGNYRGHALEQLADKGNGQALYIANEKDIQKVFKAQLTSTLEVVGKDVKVQVAFDPKVVSSYRLIGYENRAIADEDFTNDRVDAGEMGSGHTVTAMYEVSLTSVRGALGTVSVRGKSPDSGQVWEVSQPVQRKAVEHALNEQGSDFRFAAAVALGADTARGNNVGSWSLSAIARLAEDAADGRDERVEFVRFLRRLDQLRSVPTASRY